MERVQVLIDKLVQQQKGGDSITQMLMTVQMLQQELQALQSNSKPSGSGKVSVVLPSRHAVTTVNVEPPRGAVKPAPPVEAAVEAPAQAPAPAWSPAATLPEPPEAETPAAVEIPAQPAVAERTEAPPVRETYAFREDAAEEDRRFREPVVPHLPPVPEPHHLMDTHFDAMAETPTLVQQQPAKEIHELLAEQRESLNDKLKQEKVELAHLLKTTPIKDLRKAIGLNDKFAFINELFRGDESMYERSIKTINGFHILPEAEYWINRELKVKLGWNDDREIVQHFYHLVKRRFS